MDKRATWRLPAAMGGLVLLLAAAGVAAAPAATAAKDTPPLPEECALMAKECGLLADQVAEMATQIELKEKALADWNRENGPRIANYKTILGSARSRNDAAGEADALAQLDALDKAKADLIAQADAAIAGVMTAQQRATWEGYQLWQQLLAYFKKLTFTEKQSKAVRRIADGAAAQPIRDKGDPAAVEKARQERFERCVAAVLEKVLTAEQYEVFTGQPAPPRPKEETPKRRDDGAWVNDGDPDSPGGVRRRRGR